MDVLFSGDGSGGAQRACGGGLLEVAAQDQDERVVLVATQLRTASGGWAASGAADFRSLTLSASFITESGRLDESQGLGMHEWTDLVEL